MNLVSCIFVLRVQPQRRCSDPIRGSGAHADHLEAYLFDLKESLRQTMAGCILIRREEITTNSRLQRVSAILNVFSEASENPTAWVF